LLHFLSFGATAPSGSGPPLHEVSRLHTTTHDSRYDSSGRVISQSQRPLPDNTQQLQQTSMSSAGFEPTIPSSEQPQTQASGRAATGIGTVASLICLNSPWCCYILRIVHFVSFCVFIVFLHPVTFISLFQKIVIGFIFPIFSSYSTFA